MKKIISIALALIVFSLCLVSCADTENEKYPLTVNSVPIDGEIFRYFLDLVWTDTEAGGKKEGRITEATHMCIRYVAVNSTFAAYGFSLSDGEKAEISEEANALWNMFGAHYEKIGVSKETFIKIKTSDAYIEKLRIAFFDKGGTDEISDPALRGVLAEKFIAFRYVRTPVFNTDAYGNQLSLSDEDMQRLDKLYATSVSSVEASYSVEKAYTEISAQFPLTEMTYDTLVTDRLDHDYPALFFDTVKNMEENSAEAFRYENYYYLVYRMNILADVSIFDDKRSECLKIISEDPLQSKINLMCNAYESKRDTLTVNENYEQVARNR